MVHAQAAGRVVHVAAGRVVHGVAGRRLAIHLLVVDLEVLGHRSKLLRVAAQRQEGGIKVGHVGLEHFGGVALGVHSHEDALQALTVGSQCSLDLGQLLHGGGANVRALGEPEKHHHDLASKVFEVAWLAIVVGQGQVAGVLGTGDVHPLEFSFLLSTSRK